MKLIQKACIGVGLLAAMAEVGLRLLGFGDFPLYDANPVIGYIPKANQHGSFMGDHDWRFNSLHMGSDEFKPGARRNVLLVGDSLVYGGNTYQQAQKLGPTLERKMGDDTRVWPIGAGSWSINNELTWLTQHPEVVRQMDDIVFVLNSADLEDHSSSWRCETTHPRQHPWSVLVYQAMKQKRWEACADIPPGLAVPDRSWRTALTSWMQSPPVQGKRVHFILYPTVDELRSGARPVLPSMQRKLQELGLDDAVDIGSSADWHQDLYQDGIHPKPIGNEVLARLITLHLTQTHR